MRDRHIARKASPAACQPHRQASAPGTVGASCAEGSQQRRDAPPGPPRYSLPNRHSRNRYFEQRVSHRQPRSLRCRRGRAGSLGEASHSCVRRIVRPRPSRTNPRWPLWVRCRRASSRRDLSDSVVRSCSSPFRLVHVGSLLPMPGWQTAFPERLPMRRTGTQERRGDATLAGWSIDTECPRLDQRPAVGARSASRLLIGKAASNSRVVRLL